MRPPMTKDERVWLRQYCIGARIVRNWRRTLGWAVGKGWVKGAIRQTLQNGPFGGRGVTDAFLDSIGG